MGLKREKKRQRRLPGMGDPRQTSNEVSSENKGKEIPKEYIYFIYI